MNEFIARKGIISLDGAQVTGSLSVTGNISASIFTGSFVGDGSQLSGIEGFPFTGSAGITGSLTVVGPVNATTFTGDGSQLTGIEGFPFTGSARITGSLTVVGPVNATSFTGSLQGTATSASYIQLANIDGFTAYSASVNTAIDSVLDATTPLTATVNTTNTPFTLTSQSIVVADSTNGNLTINLPDLNTIVGTPNQKPIIVYKNDYSQNVIYVQPSGSQLVNGASQDIIVSIQLAVIYNPTSAGWVTEGTSAQSLAELELFFLPLTETGSLATTGSNTFIGNQTVTGSLTVTGGINATITGSAASASYVEYTNVANKPTLVSGSAQITYSGISSIPAGIVSSSTQITGYNIFATTGSNTFQANQTITGSLFITQNLVVAGSSSIQYISSSVLDIADNIITVNAFNPAIRFGGLAVIDSGSSPQVSGSILFDSIKDQWIFVHQNQSVITSSVVLMGPETYNDLGNESYISSNRLPKGSGIEHLRDSNITDTGTVVSVNSNTAVTGSFTVVTGSAVELQVTNLGVNMGSALTDSHIISGSVRINPNGLFVSGSGAVGIGTTNPSTLLHVSGSSSSIGRIVSTFALSSGFSDVVQILNPNQTGGGLSFNIGKAESTKNLGKIAYVHSSNGSDSNRLAFGFYDADNLLNLTAGGNVGIGTTNPGTRLEVSSTAPIGDRTLPHNILTLTAEQGNAPYGGFGGAILFKNRSYVSGLVESSRIRSVIYDDGTPNNFGGGLWFETTPTPGGTLTPSVIINYQGRVGIGNSSPVQKLHVEGSTAIGTTGTEDILLLGRALSGGVSFQQAASLKLGRYQNAGGNYESYTRLDFALRDNSAASNYNTNTTVMTLTNASRVGIGTTNPDRPFELYNATTIGLAMFRAANENGAAITIKNDQGSNDLSIYSAGSTAFGVSGWANNGIIESATGIVYSAYNGNHIFQSGVSGRTERMRILSGGTVYINTATNPSTDNAVPQFGIIAGSGTDAINIKHTQNANNTINIWQTGTTSHNAIAFYKGDTQTNRGLITVTTSGTTYNSVSDYRLKENIAPLENGLDRVMLLKPSKFNWIETGNETEGFIAHELQEYFPDAVTGEKDAVYSSTGNIKPQSVDYGRITPLLVKAIQEQQAQIESLKAEIQTLKQ